MATKEKKDNLEQIHPRIEKIQARLLKADAKKQNVPYAKILRAIISSHYSKK